MSEERLIKKYSVLSPQSSYQIENNDDMNHYFNTINSTLKTNPSLQKSLNYNHGSFSPSYEKDKYSRKQPTCFELSHIITFKKVSKDTDGIKAFEINKHIFNEKDRQIYYRNTLLQKSNQSANGNKFITIDRGGIVDLNYRLPPEKSKNEYQSLYNDLSEYELLNHNKLRLMNKMIKALEKFRKRYVFWKVRSYKRKKNKRTKGRCKLLLMKYQISVDEEKGEIIRHKKRFVRHSLFTKNYSRVIELIVLIQNYWREWKINMKRKTIMKTMSSRLPSLRLSLKHSIKRTKTEGIGQLKEKKKKLKIKKSMTLGKYKKTKKENVIIEDNENQPFVIRLMLLPPCFILKEVKVDNRKIINIQANKIQKNWKRQHQLSIQSSVSLPMCFMTKEVIYQKYFIADSNINFQGFTYKLLNLFILIYRIFYKRHWNSFYKSITNQVIERKGHKLKNKLKPQTQKDLYKDITLKIKFSYALGKIISKKVQESVFYYLKNYKIRRRPFPFIQSYLFRYSFYYNTLRKHLQLAKDFSFDSKENIYNPKSFVASVLSDYISQDQSLDFYSLNWNNPIKQKKIEKDISKDLFKATEKNHLICYMLIYLSAYEQKNISSHPYLIHLFIKHIENKSHQYNTSIFGISRFIQRFLHMIIVDQVPYCPICYTIIYEKNLLSNQRNIVKDIFTYSPRQNHHNCNLINKKQPTVTTAFNKIGVIEQYVEDNKSKRHIMKITIGNTISTEYVYDTILSERRQIDNERFYNMAKESKYKWK